MCVLLPWQPTPVTLAEKIPWMEKAGGPQSMDCKESDTTERLHFHFLSLCRQFSRLHSFQLLFGSSAFCTSFSVRWFTHTDKLLSESFIILGFQCCHAFFFFFLLSFTLSAIGFDKCILSCIHHYSIT